MGLDTARNLLQLWLLSISGLPVWRNDVSHASTDWQGRRSGGDGGEGNEGLSNLVSSPAMDRALWFSWVVCLTLIVSHLLTVLFIAYHDISGRWDKYSLKYQRSTWHTYVQHAPSFFFDVVCLLGPSLLAFGYVYEAVLYEPLLPHADWRQNGVRVAALLGAAIINNVINRLWAMGVHWLMHESKFLYRAVHKRHHCCIRDFCALSAWQDSILEFVLMEVFGVFLFAQLFNPLPWHFHVLFAFINGVGAAIDHSAFYIPGTIVDGRYHWDHHLRIDYNFSELEFLDSIFGTLYTHHHSISKPLNHQQSPRLRRGKHQQEEVAGASRNCWPDEREGSTDVEEETGQNEEEEEGEGSADGGMDRGLRVTEVLEPEGFVSDEDQLRPHLVLEHGSNIDSTKSTISTISSSCSGDGSERAPFFCDDSSQGAMAIRVCSSTCREGISKDGSKESPDTSVRYDRKMMGQAGPPDSSRKAQPWS